MNEGSTLAVTPTFGTLRIDPRIAAALAGIGYLQPTPIQEQAIPLLQAKRDVTGLARTGSGKTAGFGIPLLEIIRTNERAVQALVLVPTRELAAQVTQEMLRIGSVAGIRIAAIYGGVGMGAQIAALRGNTHVVVGTPGRIIDHLQRGTLDLRAVRMVVLDEADRMLDVGFAPAIENILRRVPASRQIALFSATFPAAVEALAARHTRDAVRIDVEQPGSAIDTLEQRFVRVPEEKAKADALHDILINPECKLALVFRRTTHRADKLAHELELRGFKVAVLHGRRSQSQREHALQALRSGQLQVLVATDIAARGLDITGLTHVVNFDLPDTAENYTHRIGRTARMGAVGVAITLVAPEDEQLLKSLTRRLPTSVTGSVAPNHREPARSQFSSRRPANNPPSFQRNRAPRQAPAVAGTNTRHAIPPIAPARPVSGFNKPRPHAATHAADSVVRTPQPPQRARTTDVEGDDTVWYPFQMPQRKANGSAS